LVDLPGSAPHKTHLLPTPLAGGLVIASSLAVTYLIVRPELSRAMLGIFGGAGLVVAWGSLTSAEPGTSGETGVQILAALVL
jgi:UDP-N-acetylmuramyl pentapeptide phosphotransferase/UDP-N-acetylglucosamine-1-phosphate transferase